jgi:hypothetical protein
MGEGKLVCTQGDRVNEVRDKVTGAKPRAMAVMLAGRGTG